LYWHLAGRILPVIGERPRNRVGVSSSTGMNKNEENALCYTFIFGSLSTSNKYFPVHTSKGLHFKHDGVKKLKNQKALKKQINVQATVWNVLIVIKLKAPVLMILLYRNW
jgi:hypothetical protein